MTRLCGLEKMKKPCDQLSPNGHQFLVSPHRNSDPWLLQSARGSRLPWFTSLGPSIGFGPCNLRGEGLRILWGKSGASLAELVLKMASRALPMERERRFPARSSGRNRGEFGNYGGMTPTARHLANEWRGLIYGRGADSRRDALA